MANWEIVALAVAGLFALVVLAIFGRFAGLWIQSIVSGAPVGLLDLFMMRLRALYILNHIQFWLSHICISVLA